MGHKHKSGVLFEDREIKVFSHILSLWSLGRKRRGRAKETEFPGKMFWVSFSWAERVFYRLGLQSKVPVLWNPCFQRFGVVMACLPMAFSVTPAMHYSEHELATFHCSACLPALELRVREVWWFYKLIWGGGSVPCQTECCLQKRHCPTESREFRDTWVTTGQAEKRLGTEKRLSVEKLRSHSKMLWLHYECHGEPPKVRCSIQVWEPCQLLHHTQTHTHGED